MVDNVISQGQLFLNAAHKRDLDKMSELIQEYGTQLLNYQGEVKQESSIIHNLVSVGNAFHQAIIGNIFEPNRFEMMTNENKTFSMDISYRRLKNIITSVDQATLSDDKSITFESIKSQFEDLRKLRKNEKLIAKLKYDLTVKKEMQKVCEIIKFLIQKGGDINQPNNKGKTPLHLLLSDEKFLEYSDDLIDIAECFCKLGADIDVIDDDGKTPLTLIRDQSKLLLYKERLSKYSKVDPVILQSRINKIKLINKCKTSLFEKNENKLRKCLEDSNFDPNSLIKIQNDLHYPMLAVAILNNFKEGVKILLDVGADYNVVIKHNGEICSMLTISSINNNVDIIRSLLEAGCNPNEKVPISNANDQISDLIWHVHALYGNVEIMELFLKKGVDPHMKSSQGYDVFQLLNPKDNNDIRTSYLTCIERYKEHMDKSMPDYKAIIKFYKYIKLLDNLSSKKMDCSFAVILKNKFERALDLVSLDDDKKAKYISRFNHYINNKDENNEKKIISLYAKFLIKSGSKDEFIKGIYKRNSGVEMVMELLLFTYNIIKRCGYLLNNDYKIHKPILDLLKNYTN